MKTYTIRIKIDIAPSTEPATNAPVTQSDGSVHMTLTEQEALSIDRCEQLLLQTVYPTLREALSAHLSEASKQQAMESLAEGQVVTKSWSGRVDGEVGRFEFVTYQIRHEHSLVDAPVKTLFPGLKRWEWYKTSEFKELAFIDGVTEESYQKTSRLLNRIRYQSMKEGTPSRTLREQANIEGLNVMRAIEHKAEQVLNVHEFRSDGICKGKPETYQEGSVVSLPEEQVADAIAVCQTRLKVDGDLSENPVPYEAPEWTVNLSVDDVGVKQTGMSTHWC